MRARPPLRLLPSILSLAAVTACVGPPRQPPTPPAPPPVAVPAPPPPPAPAADWRDWPRTAGDWRYTGGSRPVARYVAGDGTALASLACDPAARTMILSLAGPGTDTGTLTIRTTSVTRSLSASTAPGAATATATLSVADPLLDAMAFSRGRFTIERAGAAPLVLPAWAEVGRVIGDCRG